MTLGADVTCTIVNTDDVPKLTLVKTVTNNDGGTAVAGDYTRAATGASRPFTGPQLPRQRRPAVGTARSVTAGESYHPEPRARTRAPVAQQHRQWSCSAGTHVNADNTTVSASAPTLTCTIVNTDDIPKLTLVKIVTNNDGGTAVADDYDPERGDRHRPDLHGTATPTTSANPRWAPPAP